MPAIICPHCGQLNRAHEVTCTGCAKALYTSGGGFVAPRSPESFLTPKDLDAHLVTTRDFALLMRHAQSLAPEDALRTAIMDKLDRSEVVLSTEIAEDVVTLNSRVVFSVDEQPWETRFLVHPRDHVTPGLTLPVTTPIGIAMLGALAGDRVTALRRDGGREIVEIVRVAYQPEAASRLWGRVVSHRITDRRSRFGSHPPMDPESDGPDDSGPEAA
jgi:regulator of nucleoside diphosphate kinase